MLEFRGRAQGNRLGRAPRDDLTRGVERTVGRDGDAGCGVRREYLRGGCGYELVLIVAAQCDDADVAALTVFVGDEEGAAVRSGGEKLGAGAVAL